MSTSTERTKKLVTLAMMAAIAYVVMYVGRIPIVLFLKYDPKDVIIAIAGFIYGPLSALAVSTVVSFVEMFTVSETMWWGFLMNILSTCSFVCPAAWLYNRKRNLKNCVVGLVIGVTTMAVTMVLWNYIVTPIYMGYPRDKVAGMLVPVFLPFNLLKGGLNMALTLLLYKPVSTALRRAKLLPPSPAGSQGNKISLGVTIASLVMLATVVLLVLIFMGKI